MNQMIIGRFIAQKRKERNLTQEQLAERLGVSNKTVSKWECGKCMPDYRIIEHLCQELDISIAELMNGETKGESDARIYDNQQILDILARIQQLEAQKHTLIGILVLVMGIALLALSHTVGGTPVRDFISGVMLGLSVAEMVVGIYIVGRTFIRR
mgnify:CR=1 FL=1